MPSRSRLFISGSIHKYHNNGIQNYDDFSKLDCLQAFEKLQDELHILSSSMVILKLEWGLNLRSEYRSFNILKDCYYHQSKLREEIERPKMHMVRFYYKRYHELKLYDKALHQNLNYELLRFERKQIEFARFNSQQQQGYSISNLLKDDFKGLSKTLIDDWDKLLFINSDSSYYEGFRKIKAGLEDTKHSKCKRQAFYRKKKETKLWNKQTGYNMHSNLRALIVKKLKELN
jgi:hypothetical protein